MEKLQSEKNIESALEAVLFSVGEAVEASRLAEALDIDEETLKTAALSLKNSLMENNRGIRLVEIGDCYQLSSAAEYFEYIQKTVQIKKQVGLSSAALETLSIIAYNQPVTKGTIEFIRGVDCTYSVSKLTERGFIEEVGRAEAPGRPILYATTLEFLRCFGLKNLSELPPLPEKEVKTEESEESDATDEETA